MRKSSHLPFGRAVVRLPASPGHMSKCPWGKYCLPKRPSVYKCVWMRRMHCVACCMSVWVNGWMWHVVWKRFEWSHRLEKCYTSTVHLPLWRLSHSDSEKSCKKRSISHDRNRFLEAVRWSPDQSKTEISEYCSPSVLGPFPRFAGPDMGIH